MHWKCFELPQLALICMASVSSVMVPDSPSMTENWMWHNTLFQYSVVDVEYSVVKTDKLQGEPHERFRTPGTGLRIPCQWNLDFGFQSFADSGFLEMHYRFRSPRFQTVQAKISRIPQIWITLHGAPPIYRRLHLSVDTRQKKTCSNRVQDMTCFAAKHLKFDSCFRSAHSVCI